MDEQSTQQAEDRANGGGGLAGAFAPPPTAPLVVGDDIPVVSGVRIPRRERWVTLPGEYGELGMQFLMWVNFPRRINTAITEAEDEAERQQALMQIVLEHNGWIGTDGEPLPPANDPKFWEDVPDEVAGAILVCIMLETSELPNSEIERRRGTRNISRRRR